MENLERSDYPYNKIFNTFKPNKTEQTMFDSRQKGWDTQKNTREYMLNNFEEILRLYNDDILITKNLFDEIPTFVNYGGKYQAMKGYNDDCIVAYSLGLVASHILQRFKVWCLEYGHAETDIPIDSICTSSFLPKKTSDNDIDSNIRDDFNMSNDSSILTKEEVEKLSREKLMSLRNNRKDNKDNNRFPYFSTKESEEDDDVYTF